MKYYIVSLIVWFFTISTCWSLPAPKYLSVPHWKKCVQTMTKDSAQFVCLPFKKPAKCPSTSWKKLNHAHLIENCSGS